MDASEIAELITAFATLAGVIVSLVIGILNTRHIKEVKHATNGLSKAFGQARHDQGQAEGLATGLEQGRTEPRPGK